jgi:hypothetical protein
LIALIVLNWCVGGPGVSAHAPDLAFVEHFRYNKETDIYVSC